MRNFLYLTGGECNENVTKNSNQIINDSILKPVTKISRVGEVLTKISTTFHSSLRETEGRIDWVQRLIFSLLIIMISKKFLKNF